MLYADDRPNLKAILLLKWNNRGQKKEFPKISPHWNTLGVTFGIEPAVLHGFQVQNMLDQMSLSCCKAGIQRWLENGSEDYPVTWKGLIDALRATGILNEIAGELEMALYNSTSPGLQI